MRIERAHGRPPLPFSPRRWAAGALLVLMFLLPGCAPTYQPMGLQLAQPALAQDAIVAADGYRLPLRVWLPEGAPRAVVLALHGLNDYSVSFAPAGPSWAEAGIATYAYDQRGFGATDQPGIWPGADTLVADARMALGLLRARHPGVPLTILGESMGGAVAALAVTGEDAARVDGTVLIAPAFWGRAAMPFYQQWALAAAAFAAPWWSLTGEGLAIRPTDNVEVLRQMSADPLVQKRARVDLLDGLVTLMDEAYRRTPSLPAPALALYGDNEEVIPLSAVDRFLPRLPAGTVTVGFYERGYHMLLRDRAGQVVIDDIAAWLAEPTAPLPSGADSRGTARRLQVIADDAPSGSFVTAP